jgi:glycerate-2-kinase
MKKKVINLFEQILESVNPRNVLNRQLQWNDKGDEVSIFDETFPLTPDQPLYVMGAGKASSTMAAAAEDIFGERIQDGFIIAPPGKYPSLRFINIAEGTHPIPDQKSIHASERLMEFIRSIPDGALVLNLISGGTSSLFCVPASELTLQDIQTVYQLLIECGASIHEINTIRQCLSGIKGGRLLSALNHTVLIDLIISDVPDDDLRYIGSGPTAAQSFSFIDARSILKTYNILNRIPEGVQKFIDAGVTKEESDGHPVITQDFEGHSSFIISSAKKMVRNAAEILSNNGYQVEQMEEPWSGPVWEFESYIFSRINKSIQNTKKEIALIFYGECTVEVTGNGLGGRNQELALRMADRLSGFKREIVFLSAGTDGVDGPTDAAGAVVDQNTTEEAIKNGINPSTFLKNNDSYHFFEQAGGHIKTGPTGNNLMDLQIAIIT